MDSKVTPTRGATDSGILSVPVEDLLDSEMREPTLPPGWNAEGQVNVIERFGDLRQKAKLVASAGPGGKREEKQGARIELLVDVAYFVEWIKDQKPENEWERESHARRQLLAEIQKALKAEGLKPIKVQHNTSDASMVSRGVFGTHRRLASVFSAIIENAAKEGVGADGLAAWVQARGGFENARRDIKRDALELMWQTPPIATITLDRVLVGDQEGDLPKVLLATVRASGEVDIRGVVTSDAAANRALSDWKA
jgi:hypothetical protein